MIKKFHTRYSLIFFFHVRAQFGTDGVIIFILDDENFFTGI